MQFLVERLETLVVNARKLPMTNNVVLDQAALLDLIDQLRVAIPEEVRQARRINQESDRVLTHAREEAERIIAAAHVLLRLEGDLEKTLSIVKKSLEVLEERKPAAAEA